MQCTVSFSRQCIAGTRIEHVHSHFEVLRLSTPASGKPYRHTGHVCKDEGCNGYSSIPDADRVKLTQRVDRESRTSEV